jgi:hypothetical protein
VAWDLNIAYKILWWTYAEELVDLTSMFVMIILMLPQWPARSPIFRPFWGLFEGSKKGWKMTKNWHRDEKITSPHTLKNFTTHKTCPSITITTSKINKTHEEPKNTKKWRFLTPFQRPPKTAIFSPFLRVPKNDDFFVINDVNNKNFWWKSRSRKKSGTSSLGRGRGGPPHFSMKIVSLIPLILGGAH